MQRFFKNKCKKILKTTYYKYMNPHVSFKSEHPQYHCLECTSSSAMEASDVLLKLLRSDELQILLRRPKLVTLFRPGATMRLGCSMILKSFGFLAIILATFPLHWSFVHCSGMATKTSPLGIFPAISPIRWLTSIHGLPLSTIL